MDLAKAIVAACEQPTQFQFLYPLELSIKVWIQFFLHSVCCGECRRRSSAGGFTAIRMRAEIHCHVQVWLQE